MRTDFDIVVLAGGERDAAVRAVADLDLSAAEVIAADSGVVLADALGLAVRHAVGDFDSLEPDRLDRLRDDPDVDVRQHPRDKDAADLALALDVALERADEVGSRVLLAGIEGGRADYTLANQLLAASPLYRPLRVTLALVGATAHVVHDRCRLETREGQRLSVVPLHGRAEVTITGVRWPLSRATLEPGTTWGMGNVAVGVEATVIVHSGTVMCFEQSGD